MHFLLSFRATLQGTALAPNKDGVVCVDRSALARYMVKYAQEKFPDIEFHFNMQCKVTGLPFPS